MERVGNYTLGQPLGQGATARVFRAERDHSHDGAKTFAIKIFHPHLGDTESIRRRISKEVHAGQMLGHPNIARMIEPLLEHDPPAMVFELVDGLSLDRLQPTLPSICPEISVLLVIEVLLALEHAHSRGVLHRDLKPANILVSREGRVVLTDFGLAKINETSIHTLSGTVVGSPDFMAPEQARGEATSEVSDLFSAAAVLYFLVTGVKPFSRPTPLATLAAVNEARFEPAHLRNPKVSAHLSSIINQGLCREPSDRFQSASDFKFALARYLDQTGLPMTAWSFATWRSSETAKTFEALRQIAAHLAQKARDDLKAGQPQLAMERLSHLSLVAPESRDLNELLAQVTLSQSQANRKKKAIVTALSAVALLFCGALGARVLKRNTDASLSATEAKAVPSPETQNLIESQSKAVPPMAAAPRVQSTAARDIAPKPIDRNLYSPIRFSLPSDVVAYWDGKRVGPEGLPPQKIGPHSLKLYKSGFPPISHRVRVNPGEPTIINVGQKLEKAPEEGAHHGTSASH